MFDDTFQPAEDYAREPIRHTAFLSNGTEHVWVHAVGGEYPRVVLHYLPVTLPGGEMPGLVREIYVGRRNDLTDHFYAEAARIQNGNRLGTAPWHRRLSDTIERVWSADPWDAPSVLDRAVTF